MSDDNTDNDEQTHASFALNPIFAENLFFLTELMKTPQAMPQLLEMLLALRELDKRTERGNNK